MIKIKEIKTNKKDYLNILLIGDEQENMIDKYIEDSSLFVLFSGEEPKSVCAVIQVDTQTYEIKNLATVANARKTGYATTLLEYVCTKYKKSAKTIILGTGETPKTLNFYRKRGFKEFRKIKDFFTNNYNHPIFEDGRQLKDMIYLRRKL